MDGVKRLICEGFLPHQWSFLVMLNLFQGLRQLIKNINRILHQSWFSLLLNDTNYLDAYKAVVPKLFLTEAHFHFENFPRLYSQSVAQLQFSTILSSSVARILQRGAFVET